MATTHSPVRLTYKGRIFDVLPVYKQEPDWQWVATVTELSPRDQSIIAGRGTLGADQHPRVAVTNAIGLILESIDQDKPVL